MRFSITLFYSASLFRFSIALLYSASFSRAFRFLSFTLIIFKVLLFKVALLSSCFLNLSYFTTQPVMHLKPLNNQTSL